MTETLSKRQVVGTAMAMLAATFNRELSTGALEGYWQALQHLEEADLRRATGRALQECRFMPTPVELIQLSGKARNVEAECATAWQTVRRAIDRYDYTVGSIDFGNRTNAVVANLGGWDMLCKANLAELDNPGWLRKRFEEVWQAYANTTEESLRGDALSGALPDRWVTGVPHVVVQVPGQPEVKRLPPQQSEGGIGELVRNLADGKGLMP
jgi:hypothetical protein